MNTQQPMYAVEGEEQVETQAQESRASEREAETHTQEAESLAREAE